MSISIWYHISIHLYVYMYIRLLLSLNQNSHDFLISSPFRIQMNRRVFPADVLLSFDQVSSKKIIETSPDLRKKKIEGSQVPDAPCMEYLPTFTLKLLFYFGSTQSDEIDASSPQLTMDVLTRTPKYVCR